MRKQILICLILFFTIFVLFPEKNFAIEEDNDFFEYSEIEKALQTVSNVSNFPDTNSAHIIAIDRESERILFEKNGFDKTPMASTTKIMTAIIAIENCNLNESVLISKKAASVSGSTLGILANTEMSIHDLLYGLMLCSGNDCAVAIAEHIGGSVEGFSTIMNNKAKELKLKNTNFVTPHGLDNDNHYTTAYELAILSNYALDNNTFKQIVGTKEAIVTVRKKSKKHF